MKKLTILFFILLSAQVFSQNEQQEVMKVVNQVFEAMRTNDSTLLKNCFIESPATYTVYKNQEGKNMLRTGDFKRFVAAVGQPKKQVWNEPIWNEKVEIDGGLASVWVDYAFYIDDQFSHCGVDAFHLILQNGNWKIFHLVDTRRSEDCEVPDEFKP